MSVKSFICSLLKKNEITERLYNKISSKIQYIRDWKNIKYPIIKAKRQNPNIAFLLLTPNHTNLGDVALAIAEKQMLRELNIEFIEFDISKFVFFMNYDWLKVMNGQPIFFNGGGNLGTLWFGIEEFYRNLIKKCPKSKILFFPNTIYYEDTEFGKKEYENAKNIYNNHKNLIIYTREKTSFKTMLNDFNSVKLAPDMAFSLNYSEDNNLTKNGCILCLRSDVEKTIPKSEKENLIRFANYKFSSVTFSDTCIEHIVSIERREAEINKKLDEFKGAELVITDRLHGMIFCAISGTPCILLNSKSPKIKGCYEWVKNLPYIRFCDNVSDIEKIYDSIPKGSFKYDNSHLLPLFDELKKDIMSLTNKRR